MTRDEILKTLASGLPIVIDAPMEVATTGNDAIAGDTYQQSNNRQNQIQADWLFLCFHRRERQRATRLSGCLSDIAEYGFV